MLLIDLDSDEKQENHVKPKIVIARYEAISPTNVLKEEFKGVSDKEKLLLKLQQEENLIRIDRSKTHRRYFDLLGPDLLPISGADFSDIYQEMRVYQNQLKDVYVKRMQVEDKGSFAQPKYMTDAILAKLGAMKHERSNAFKLKSKKEKAIIQAQIKGNTNQVIALEQKAEEINRKILSLTHEIKKITEDGFQR